MIDKIKSKLKKQRAAHLWIYIITLAIVGWFLFGYTYKKPIIAVEHTVKAVTVDTEVMNAEEIQSDILIYGTTAANYRVDLKMRTAGQIQDIFHRKGSFVRKGDKILCLRMDDRNAKLTAQKAAVQKAALEYKTAQELIKEDLISRVDFITTESNYKAQSAALEQVNNDISYTCITAPFDGIVNRLDVELGQYVASGGLVGEFLEMNPIIIKADLPEKYISRVKLGSSATAVLSSEDTIKATLYYVGSSANATTRTFALELSAPNPKGRIKEGLTAEIRFPLNTVMATKIKVSSCLTFGEKGQVGVKVLNKDDIVEFYPIELVREEDDGIWVAGLPKNANVIIAGQEFVNVGEKAKAKE